MWDRKPFPVSSAEMGMRSQGTAARVVLKVGEKCTAQSGHVSWKPVIADRVNWSSGREIGLAR